MIVTCLAVALAAVLVLAAPAGAGRADTPAKRVVARLKDSYFSPSRAVVRPGGRVRFVWAGRLVHNLIGPGIPRRLADPARRRRSFDRVFRRPGFVRFTCSIHPGMEIAVRVRR